MSGLAVMLKPIESGWAVILTDGRELARFTGLGAQGSCPVLHDRLQVLKTGPFRPLSSQSQPAELLTLSRGTRIVDLAPDANWHHAPERHGRCGGASSDQQSRAGR